MKAACFIPVLFLRAERAEEGWGRFLSLDPFTARLLTRSDLRRGEEVFLSFELEGDRFDSLRSKVFRVRRDADRYWVCELSFSEQGRVLLGRALMDMAVRSKTP